MKTIFNDIVLIVFKWWHFHWVSIHSIVIFWCFQNIKENFRHLRSIKLEILSLFDIELEIHFQLQNYNFRNWIVSCEWAFDHVFNFGVYSFFKKKRWFFLLFNLKFSWSDTKLHSNSILSVRYWFLEFVLPKSEHQNTLN